jgi:hypothetical protein
MSIAVAAQTTASVQRFVDKREVAFMVEGMCLFAVHR